MKGGWTFIKLQDHCDVFPGYAFDSSKFSTSEEDVHLVKGENLHQGYIDWQNAKRWSVNELEKLKKFQLKNRDIVVAMDRPWIEVGLKWSVIKKNDPSALLVQRVARLRAKNDLTQSFLSHVIGGKLFEGYIKPIVTGVNVPHISGTQIGNFKFYIPSITAQRNIAAVLSAYDDLIENNDRRIAILEKMAEELYREWFVRLRFPDHEKVKIVKGVPEGWEVKDSLTLFHVLGGGTPKTEVPNYWDGELPFFTPKDAHAGYFVFETEKSITQLGLENCNSALFPKNTIFITARGTVGKIVLASRPMAMNQSCYALEPKQAGHVHYYFLAMRSVVDIIRGTSNSGVFDNIITDSFKQFNLFKPDKMILNRFNEIVVPVFQEIENKAASSALLVITRDRLLSRLMSGKLDVADLDIRFPESMKEDAAAHA